MPEPVDLGWLDVGELWPKPYLCVHASRILHVLAPTKWTNYIMLKTFFLKKKHTSCGPTWKPNNQGGQGDGLRSVHGLGWGKYQCDDIFLTLDLVLKVNGFNHIDFLWFKKMVISFWFSVICQIGTNANSQVVGVRCVKGIGIGLILGGPFYENWMGDVR